MKVLFIGNTRTGKTNTVNRLKGLKNVPHRPTVGADVYTYINKNGTEVSIWDCAGKEELTGLRDGYFIGADVAVIFGEDITDWYRDVSRASDKMQVILNPGFVSLRRLLNSL
jgi:GTP-binding nuclear protein Ran